jgi:signal transduction histidine kinase/HD-like signal output (HDOD) protein
MMRTIDPAQGSQASRVELILQQLDALPTLSAVAVRVLELTSAEDSAAREVIELVSCDPALASKVLKLCRCSPGGRAAHVTTVERAVVLIGFDAIRSAVLSVGICDLFESMESRAEQDPAPAGVFDRQAFWQHSLAVAVISEALAHADGLRGRVNAGEAFIAGLLHDLGLLALQVLLPRSFDRVCELAEGHGLSLSQAAKRIIGIDTHTAGKRLADHWRLPHMLADVLWLHGQPYGSLPDLPHRPMIGLVTVADAMARRMYVTPAGHGPRGESLDALGAPIGVAPSTVESIAASLHAEVSRRADALGMNAGQSTEVLLRSVARANEVLGRINATLRQQATLAARQSSILKAITRFHDAPSLGGSIVDALGKVVMSAAESFTGSFFAVLYQQRSGDPWQLIQFAADGRAVRSQIMTPPEGAMPVADLADPMQVSMQVLVMLPSLAEYVGPSTDVRNVRLLPLKCGWGISAVLLHDAATDGRADQDQIEALSRTWAAAIAAAAQHEGARRLGEQLAQANLTLTETQEELARSKAMAALGEMAAGAAHEMNNPLTVISGRSQLLAGRLEDRAQRLMAEQIVEQSHRLSDLITAIKAFATPAPPRPRPVDLTALLLGVVRELYTGDPKQPQIETVFDQSLPPVRIDPDQIGSATRELVRNALEADGVRHIELRVQIDPVDDRLKIVVTDDGSGLSEHALVHAFDPFFSLKPAGRQPGLGLSLARQKVAAHGGQVTLENGPSRGAVATIWLAHWRAEAAQYRAVA